MPIKWRIRLRDGYLPWWCMPGNSAMQEAEAEDSQIQGLQSELKDNLRNLATVCLKLKIWKFKRAVYSSAVDHVSNVRKTTTFKQPMRPGAECVWKRPTFIVLTPFHYTQLRFYLFLFSLLNVKRRVCIWVVVQFT